MLKNWAGNLVYGSRETLFPTSLMELQDKIAVIQKVKLVGTGHSFSNIADTNGVHISLEKMPSDISIDRQHMTVHVTGHITYGYLAKELQMNGLALHNLASLPHISIAGAVATATHGSGVGNRNLAGSVIAFEIVDANGEIHVYDTRSNAEAFNGAVIGLGAIGAVTALTLRVEPTFNVRQFVYSCLPPHCWKQYFDDIMGVGYSVSLFTDWKSSTMNQVWIKATAEDPLNFDPSLPFFDAIPCLHKMHPIPKVSPVNCTEQLGIEGPWLDRLPHFRIDFMPSAGSELQSEYILPRRYAVEALNAIGTLRDQISPVLLISEIRTIASNPFWMSTASETDSIAIHFTWKDMPQKVWDLLPKLETVLKPFQARPHWGKLFTTLKEELERIYPKMNSFRLLVKEMDPSGKFQNEFLRLNIMFSAILFTYFANEHYLIRLVVNLF